MAAGFTLKGTPEVKAKIALALILARKQAADGLYKVGEEMMAESKGRVPIDTGNLKNSGHVTQPDANAREIEVTLGYGGPAAPYAIIVHEDVEDVVPRPGGVGQSKFLESVVREYAPYLLSRVAELIHL